MTSLLNSLTEDDMIGLVTFSTTADKYSSLLSAASTSYISSMITYIDTLQPYGKSNFTDGST